MPSQGVSGGYDAQDRSRHTGPAADPPGGTRVGEGAFTGRAVFRARSILTVIDSRPAVNDPVVLRDADEREYRSRVERLGAGRLTVTRPLDLPVEDPPGVGTQLLVTWRQPRGVAVLPTRVLESVDEDGLGLWMLVAVGQGWVEQRRDFVRVPVSGPVTVGLRGDGVGTESLTGRLVDVSEAALRCSLDDAATRSLGEPGTAVQVGFRLGDQDFDIPAHVAFERTGPASARHVEVVVLFDEPVRDADTLRRQIFAQQLRTVRA